MTGETDSFEGRKPQLLNLGHGRTVLVVDDEPAICRLLRLALQLDGFEVTEANCVERALEHLAQSDFDLVFSDKNLSDGSGLALARYCLDNDLRAKFIIMTGYASFQSAREALQLGVADYIEKPFKDIDELRAHVERVMQRVRLEEEKQRLIAENKALEALTARDPLTGLFNHAYLQETVEREILRCDRYGGSVSVLFVDLDRFKEVNDTLGHVAGDRLLKLISNALTGEARRTDLSFRAGPNDIAARYGGDEFALILPDTDKRGATTKAERLRDTIDSFDFAGIGFPHQTVSIGVANYPTDASDREGLIRAADAALYAAKRTGRNRIAAYNKSLTSLMDIGSANTELDAMKIEALEHSIAGLDFDYVYQPIVRAKSGRVVGYAALCRPRHEMFPHVGTLIETAERVGRIGPLGRAMRQCSIRALEYLPSDAMLFINLHPQELFDPEFNSIEPFIAQWSDRVVFEITEVAGIRDYERVKEIISRLRGSGFRIALDDLGSGYSGLNSLALLEPDFVKLDMALVRNLTEDPRTRRLVKHILEFAHGEGMRVVAEGIETEREHEIVRSMGVELLQGFLFGRGEPVGNAKAA